MKKLEKVTLERFSLKKYQKYQLQGLPVRLVTGNGCEVHIIAQNIGVEKNQHIVETEVMHSNYNGKPFVDWWAITGSGSCVGCNDYKFHVYIQTGAINVKKGDIILYGRHSDDSFYFMAVYDHISCLDGKGMPGFCLRWTMDLHGQQFCQAGTFHDIDRSINDSDFYMRKATEEEEDKYWKFIEDNGLRLDEKQGVLVYYPNVGQPYWTIEMEGGEYKVVAHDAPTCQEERPIHDLCFSTESEAQRKVEDLKRPRW